MPRNISTSGSLSENTASAAETGRFGSPVPSMPDPEVAAPATPGNFSQEVSFTIVDDPENEGVYKGAGSYAATRAESAVRFVEKAFPLVLFELRFEKNLSALHVRARVPSPVENDVFLAVLSNALASTATRLAPIVGELHTRPFASLDPPG